MLHKNVKMFLFTFIFCISFIIIISNFFAFIVFICILILMKLWKFKITYFAYWHFIKFIEIYLFVLVRENEHKSRVW